MPGALERLDLNPFAQFSQYTGGSQADYDAGVAKGYQWGGTGWNYVGGGTQQTDAMKKFGVPMGDAKDNYYGKGASTGMGGGGGGSSSSSMFGGTMFGGKNPFATDAAAAKLRDEFARMRKRTQGGINEDLAARGIFSSGVGADLSNQAMTQLDLQEGAALEDLFNRSAQQQLAFQLEQERLKNQALYGGGGSQRFSGADTGGNKNQQVQDYYNSKGEQAANQGGGTTYKSQVTTRRDASSDFYKKFGKWPSPSELDYYMNTGHLQGAQDISGNVAKF